MSSSASLLAAEAAARTPRPVAGAVGVGGCTAGSEGGDGVVEVRFESVGEGGPKMLGLRGGGMGKRGELGAAGPALPPGVVVTSNRCSAVAGPINGIPSSINIESV